MLLPYWERKILQIPLSTACSGLLIAEQQALLLILSLTFSYFFLRKTLVWHSFCDMVRSF